MNLSTTSYNRDQVQYISLDLCYLRRDLQQAHMHEAQTEGYGIKSSVPPLTRSREGLALLAHVIGRPSSVYRRAFVSSLFSPALTHEPLWM